MCMNQFGRKRTPSKPKRAWPRIRLVTGTLALLLPALAHAEAGYRIQLAAYRTELEARAAWDQLLRANVDLLGGLQTAIERADLGPGRGVYFRLRTSVLESEAAAARLCRELKTRKQDCLIVSPLPESWPRITAAQQKNLSTQIESLEKTVARLTTKLETRGIAPVENGGESQAASPPSAPAELLTSSAGAPASAPEVPAAPAPSALLSETPVAASPQGYVEALGGLTFQTEPSIFGAGAILVNVTPRFQLFGELGYLANVLPGSDQEIWDATAFDLSNDLGMRVEIDSKAPFYYGMVGGRLFLASSGAVRPYLAAGTGVARGSETRRIVLGDRDLTEDFRVHGDNLVQAPRTTAFVLAFGGGINVSIARGVTLDAGYRYMKLLVEQRIFSRGNGVDVSRIYVGVGYGF